MSNKSEEQRAEEAKESVNAMRRAQQHMTMALDRINKLELALKMAAQRLGDTKMYVARDVYTYRGEKRVHDLLDEWAEDARKPL